MIEATQGCAGASELSNERPRPKVFEDTEMTETEVGRNFNQLLMQWWALFQKRTTYSNTYRFAFSSITRIHLSTTNAKLIGESKNDVTFISFSLVGWAHRNSIFKNKKQFKNQNKQTSALQLGFNQSELWKVRKVCVELSSYWFIWNIE